MRKDLPVSNVGVQITGWSPVLHSCGTLGLCSKLLAGPPGTHEICMNLIKKKGMSAIEPWINL